MDIWLCYNAERGHNAFTTRMITSKDKRTFLIKFLSYENGCFISVSESLDRIGLISVISSFLTILIQPKLYQASSIPCLLVRFLKGYLQ